MKWLWTWTLLINVALIILISGINFYVIIVIVFTICFCKKIFHKPETKKWIIALIFTGVILVHFGINYQRKAPKITHQKITKYQTQIKEQYPSFYIVNNKNNQQWYLPRFYYQKGKVQYLNLNNGDEIIFCAKAQTIKNPEIKNWLWKTRTINQQLKIIQTKKCSIAIKHSSSLVNKWKKYLQKIHSQSTWEWIQFLLFQQTNRNFLTTKRKINNLGILHLFVISGFHLLLWAKLWFWLGSKQKKIYLKKIFELGGLISCGFLVYLTGWKISALKSLLILIIFWINQQRKTKNQSNYKEQIALVALLFIAWDPRIFWKISFQLTFLASWLLMNESQNVNKRTSYLSLLLYKNLLIMIFILPIIVQLNYQIPIFAPFFSWIFTFMVMILYPFFFLTIAIPYLATIWTHVFIFLQTIITWTQQINLTLPFVFNNTWWIGLYYVLIIIFYALYQHFGHGKEIFLISVWAITLFLITIIQPQKTTYYLHMINMGHGLAMLLHNPNKTTNILLDVGSGKRNINHSQRLVQYLKKEKINHLSALFISHQHTDHYNNFLQVQNNIFIERVITNTNQQLKYQIREVLFQNLAYSYYQNMKEENNRSLVLQTNINHHWLLFPFDVEQKGENELIKNSALANIDLLQIAHHGSLTSSSQVFLTKIKPQYCLISARKISYITKKKLNNNKCQTWITGLHGNIIVKLDQKIMIKTQR